VMDNGFNALPNVQSVLSIAARRSQSVSLTLSLP
jgi:hypothetical protein